MRLSKHRRGRLVDVIFGYDFFISYTWADGSKYARSLYEKLKAQGFTVFLDEEEYARGDNWTLLGRRALKKTRQLICRNADVFTQVGRC